MRIILYDEGVPEALDIDEIARYLPWQVPGAQIERRARLVADDFPTDKLADVARGIAASKIPGINQKLQPGQAPLYGEVEFEKRRLLGRTKAFGVVYDGIHLQGVLRETIPEEERLLRIVHVVFTNRLFATWHAGDRRYHLRTSVYGMPSIVSTTGFVEAPAKPREYYLLKQQYESLGHDLTELKERFTGRFIDYDDERLTEVAKGMALQAIAYSLTGSPFCEDKGCRLYNAHWQKDLIFAQIESGYELCSRHRDLLSSA